MPQSASSTWTISELAEEFSVTARALRFYEDKGLLTPTRHGQARVFSATDRARLRLILRGKRVGFSLEEIREMLDLESITSGSPQHLGVWLTRFRARIEVLKQQRRDIDGAIEELETGCAWMEARQADLEPSAELKSRARAFEALARARLEH
ncbi:MAG: transcriptional regulator [Robiginitomaculum sp.]|nr:MAG: transcriptional regulator [Robiginitomaculum sp.]